MDILRRSLVRSHLGCRVWYQQSYLLDCTAIAFHHICTWSNNCDCSSWAINGARTNSKSRTNSSDVSNNKILEKDRITPKSSRYLSSSNILLQWLSLLAWNNLWIHQGSTCGTHPCSRLMRNSNFELHVGNCGRHWLQTGRIITWRLRFGKGRAIQNCRYKFTVNRSNEKMLGYLLARRKVYSQPCKCKYSERGANITQLARRILFPIK